jgi:hypothetical protein
MLKSILLAAGLAVAALSAQAATMKAVYTGTIRDLPGLAPSVADGLFGFAGPTSLAGQGFSLTFLYNTRRGTRIDLPTFAAVFSPDGQVVRVASLAINGVTLSLDDPVVDFIGIGTNEDGKQTYMHDMNAPPQGTGTAPTLRVFALFSSGFAVDLDRALALDVTDSPGSTFAFSTAEGSASGWLDADRLTIAPIPLPATLPLALAALAGLGFVARGRRAG